MIKPFILTLLFILAIFFNNLQAQSYSSVHYDAKDGLPSATVYDISQDKNGFIWFATENGLCRFDGKNFKIYTTKDGLPDNSILKVHADNSGRVYFVPFTHGLYYYENDRFARFPVPDQYKVDLSVVSTFFNKGNKVVLSGFEDSYFVEDNQLISFSSRYNIRPDHTFLDRVYDTLMIARTTSQIFFIPDSGKVRYYNLNDKVPVEFDEKAREIHLDVEKQYDFIQTDYLPGNLVCLKQNNALDIFNVSTGKLVYKIKADKISDTFMDNESNLWVATLGGGVFRYPSFGFISMAFDRKSEIFSLLKTNNGILAGTDFSKMYNIYAQNTPFHYSYTTTDLSAFTPFAIAPNAPATKRNRIYVLHQAEDNVYVGTDVMLLKQTGTSNLVDFGICPVKDIDVVDDRTLVSTGHRVLLLNKEKMSSPDTLLKHRATCGIIYKGDYYIGTIGGLIKIDGSDHKITELYQLFPLFRGRVTSLKRGKNDDLWIATSGSGLICFKKDKIVQVLKEEDGLTSDICTSLFIDSNLIWLGTDKGLNRIETGHEKPVVTRFTSANGLGADFINAVVATDSIVFVGTAEGVTAFNKNILTEKSVCILHILQVSENNRKLKKDSSYSFPHNALNIRIDFTAISFKSAGDIAYYYQLKGLSQKWDTTTARWQTWLFRIIALSAIGLLVLVVYRYNISNIKRKEKSKREVESRFAALEQRALQAQMNPHFIFNALNSIQTFILNLDVEGANTYLTSFASLIRQTLENSMHPLITVASEIKYLETYLRLEKLRFRDKFRYDIHVDEGIDQNNTVLPGMLLQPYIENSLRHGIQHRKDNNGLISLIAKKTVDNSILYTITDNGVGRKRAEELRSSQHIEYQSRGTSINEKRIAAINNQFNTNIRVNTGDITDENGIVTGTTVSVLIPHL